MKILFLYAGVRKKIFEDSQKALGPDTELLGLNHMKDYGIEADFLENSYTNFFRKISFQLTQIPALFFIRQYDVVYSASGLILLFFIKYILRWKKPLWIIHNSNLCRLLAKNKTGLRSFIIKQAIASSNAIISPVSAQLPILERNGFDAGRNYYAPCSIDADFYSRHQNDPRVIPGKYILSMGRDMGRDYITLIKWKYLGDFYFSLK